MKAELYDLEGKRKKEIDLPKVFDTKVREDIVAKYFEASKFDDRSPYAPNKEAGKRHSASGTISHRRHEWKGHYGKGISRIPRKTMWRRGTQFVWVGAEISSARGGRRAHPPRVYREIKKMNKKEVMIALNSALAATANLHFVQKRYASLSESKAKFPIVIESGNMMKTKNFILMLQNILGETYNLALKKKVVRAGKGKGRGRKYKSNAGILLVKSKSENLKISGMTVRSLNDLKISDLYPLGRITIYTEKALNDLEGRK